MTIQYAQLIDSLSGFFLVFDAIALRLFEGLTWHSEEKTETNASLIIFSGYSSVDDNAVCSIMIADASNDATEPDINKLIYKDIPSLHAELIEGVAESNLANGVKTVSFEDSKLFMQNGRRYLKTGTLVEKANKLFKGTNYRFTVNDHKYVMIIDVDASIEDELSPKLARVFDTLRFTDRLEDMEYINNVINADSINQDTPPCQELLNHFAQPLEEPLETISSEVIKEHTIEKVFKEYLDIKGFLFPPVVENYKRRDDYRDYENEQAGLGFSVGYSLPGCEVTVYVYDLQKVAIGNQDVANAFNDAISETSCSLEKRTQNGEFISTEFDDAYEITIEQGMKVLVAQFTEQVNKETTNISLIYLTHMRDKFIKFRFTCLNTEVYLGNPDKFRNTLLRLMNNIYYPRLLRRIQAALIDSVILLIVFYSMILLPYTFSIESGIAKVAILSLPIFFYEPLLVTLFGGTVGHHAIGIKVRKENQDKNLNIFLSTFRFLIKTTLGIYSFILILATKKHQAIHDKMTNSIVILKNTKKLPNWEKQTERE